MVTNDASASNAIVRGRRALCHDPGGRAPSPPPQRPPRRDPGHPPARIGIKKRTGFDGYCCASALGIVTNDASANGAIFNTLNLKLIFMHPPLLSVAARWLEADERAV